MRLYMREEQLSYIVSYVIYLSRIKIAIKFSEQSLFASNVRKYHPDRNEDQLEQNLRKASF